MTSLELNRVERGGAPAATVGLWLPTLSLWRREMVRFFRQRSRVIGALATPVLIWLGLGFGFNSVFRQASAAAGGPQATLGYLEYFFPGTVALMVLFTAIFSTISVIEDRREGFMQGVLAAPIPRLAVVMGKVLGGASIAMIQATPMLVAWLVAWRWVAPWPGWAAAVEAVAAAAVVLAVLAVALTALGMCIAWPMDSVSGFHAVMNLLLMPMWFLSGAMFPVSTAPTALRVVMLADPMTYGQSAFAQVLTCGRVGTIKGVSLAVSLAVLAVFTIGMVALAAALVGRRRKDGLG